MEISPTTITLVGVVCVALGILAGLLINSLLEGGDDATEASTEAANEAPPGGRKGKYTPVFRVWREKQAGTLVVEMDGKAMIAPDPLTEAERERLERTVRDLRAWLGMGLATTHVSQTEDARQTTAFPETAAGATDATTAADDDLSRVFGTVSANTAPPNPSSLPVQPVRVARPADPRSAAAPPVAGKGKEEPVVPPSSKSIVLQIEDILQDMIAGTDLERRGVHLLEDPVRGVIVLVGAEQFEGIGAVSDPYVRGVIQSAVQEWEQSQ